MTCYFRYIKHIFEGIGVEVTKENKKDIDKVIHELVGVTYKDCSSTWKAVKVKLAEDEEVFILDLKNGLNL